MGLKPDQTERRTDFLDAKGMRAEIDKVLEAPWDASEVDRLYRVRPPAGCFDQIEACNAIALVIKDVCQGLGADGWGVELQLVRPLRWVAYWDIVVTHPSGWKKEGVKK